MIRTTPTSPSAAPRRRTGRVDSWRVISAVARNTKIGEVEFSTLAKPLSTNCWPQANTVQAPMLLSQACTRSRRQTAAPRGSASRVAASTASTNSAARPTRTAMRVSGGMVSSATLMNR